jgi:hypothetical protein
MADIETQKISQLPEALTTSDSDAVLIVQGNKAKKARPSLFKGKKGDPGENAYLRYSGGWVQWRLGIAGSWVNLIPVSDLQGDSAYRVAVNNGFKGTEQEWIASLSAASESAAAIALAAAKVANDTNILVVQAEEARAEAETARTEAEEGRAQAESGRATAEAERVTEEGKRVTAETGRATGEGKRKTAEAARATAEEGRSGAEAARVTAEQGRVTAEQGRVTAEGDRETAENNRASAETIRGENEDSRQTAETAREEAETLRAEAETARATAETNRAGAETAREAAESGRVEAEGKRQTDTGKAIDDANAATTAANSAAGRANAAAAISEELNAHQPIQQPGTEGNLTWWVWNPEDEEYTDTCLPVRGPQGKPLIVLDNGNYGNWNEETEEYEDSGVEATSTVDIENQTVTFTEAKEKTAIASGDTLPVLFGKIKKWLSSLGALAWKSVVDYDTDVINTPSIPDAQIQSDWNQTNGAQKDYIKNKPSFKTVFSQAITGTGNINLKLINDIQYDGATGDITLKFSDGSNDKIINIPVDNFLSAAEYDPETRTLTLAMQNGEEIYIDLGDLVHEYEAAEGGGLEIINDNQFGISSAVMSEIMKAPVQKETELDVADWTENGDLWNYVLSDSYVTANSFVILWPDWASRQVARDADIFEDVITGTGTISLKATNKPTADISIKYTIEN